MTVYNGSAFHRNVQVTVGPDGTVFIASMDEGGGGLGNRTNIIYRSTNGGTTWTNTTTGAAFPGPGQSTCGYFAAMFPSYWRHMGWGDVAAGPSGIIHYAYAQQRPRRGLRRHLLRPLDRQRLDVEHAAQAQHR